MNKRFIFLVALFLFPGFFSCNLNEDADETEKGINLAEGAEETSDYQFTESEATVITLNGSSAAVSGDGASVSGATVTITSPGDYKITGTLTNGQIVIKAQEEGIIRLILNGVNVSNSNTSPLFVDAAEKVVLVLNDGTTNTFRDGTSYSDTDEGQNAAIYSQAYLSVYGEGKLVVDGNYADGIGAKDGMVIKSGTIEVTAVDDGIRGKDYLLIHDANITVNCGGDGLKSNNETDSSLGYVYIEAGTFNITASADGISAQTALVTKGGQYTITSGGGSSHSVSDLLSAKAIKAGGAISLTGTSFNLSAAEDGIHSDTDITIDGGTYTISAYDDGIHATTNITFESGDISITKSEEGVEGKFITVNSGNISVVSNDDGFNATAGTQTERNDGSYIYINGGTIVLNSSTGDALDSNGSIEMKSGTVILHGPKSQPEVAIDYNGTYNLSGGFLIASGPSSQMLEGPGSSSSQKSVMLVFRSSNSASTIFNLQNSSGNSLVTFKPARAYSTIVFSSAELVSGQTYSVYTGGSTTGSEVGGLYTGGTYSGGTLRQSISLSGTTTSITIN